MHKQILKSETFISKNLSNVDKENGIIKGVVIIEEGICKNNDMITETFLTDLVDLATAQKQGVKSRFGHPNMCGTTFGKYVGRFKNYRVIEDGKLKVVADLFLDEITKKTSVEGQEISMFEYITDMADRNPDMFGTSIHFTAKKKPYKEEGKNVQNDKGFVSEPKILSYIASDFVDTPAAASSLFKDSDDLGIKVTNFLDENPEVVELFKNDKSEIIFDFFTKYFNKQNKKDMSILKKLRKKLGIDEEQKNIDITLANGQMVTVVTENETPQVGDEVVDQEGSPVEDGEHIDKDENVIVTEGGKITEIRPKEGDEEEEEEEEEEQNEVAELQKSVDGLSDKLDNVLTQLSAGEKKNTATFEMIAKELDKTNDEFKTLKKTIKTDYKPAKEQKKGLENQEEETMYEKIQAQREKRKENNED